MSDRGLITVDIYPLNPRLQVGVSAIDPAELYGLDPARAHHADPYTRLALEALWVLTPETVLNQTQQQGRDLLEIRATARHMPGRCSLGSRP
ncbi:hypothetical protein K7W42_18340 [Deinococcus sp. HMF7604]|uniref:hypothetical protein n=1 Tax=Deinococcus betulae TaxID=2873312 RepID=UPI001CCB7A95|nr:hypothetical protein [Deinococcus betulae]MBZ9752803.1 hypothetical protein [Deinococcus betulae]